MSEINAVVLSRKVVNDAGMKIVPKMSATPLTS